MRSPSSWFSRRLVLLGGLTSVLAACGGGGDPTEPTPPPPPPPPPPPVAISLSPATTNVNAGGTQSFTATVTNSANTAVTWTMTGGTVAGTGNTVTWTAPMTGGTYTVTATSAADASKSASASATVAPIGISISPATGTVGAAGTQSFTATLTGTASTDVAWTASGGTVNGTGATATWTAPVSGGEYTITAASVADPTRSAAATITVTPVRVALTPAATVLYRGEPTSLTAAVTGTTADTTVTWSTTCGTLTGSAATVQYTAPTTPGTCAVVARSTLDVTQTDTVLITVRAARLVTALDDTNDGACTWQHCSLREAITAANAAPDADTIHIGQPAASMASAASARRSGQASSSDRRSAFRGGTARANITGTLTLTSALPAITTSVVIIGAGSAATIIDANATPAASRRVLTINGNLTATVRGLTLRGGNIGVIGGGGVLIDGGANVRLADVVIADNQARGSDGGGLLVLGTSTARLDTVIVEGNRTLTGLHPGGGIRVGSGSTLHMTGGAVRNNRTENGLGGGLHGFNGAVTMRDVVVQGNTAGGVAGSGGGLAIEGPTGSATLHELTVTANSANADAGGLRLEGLATATVTGSTFADNSAPVAGGFSAGNVAALTVTGFTIARNIAATAAGGVLLWGATNGTFTDGTVADNRANQGHGGGFFIQNTARAVLADLDITGNRASGPSSYGGGVFGSNGTTIHVRRGTIADNQSQNGWGAGYYAFTNTSTLDSVTVTGNHALNGFGGGVCVDDVTLTMHGGTVADNTATEGEGGGIFTRNSMVVLDDVVVRDNVADRNGGGIRLAGSGARTAALNRVTVSDNRSDAEGGGVSTEFTTTVRSSTISGNRSRWGGGGMEVNGTMTLEHVTIVDNTGDGGGGLWVGWSGVTTVRNSTLSGNTSTWVGGGMVTAGAATLTNVTVAGNTAAGGSGGVEALAPANMRSRVAANRAASPAAPSNAVAFSSRATLTNVLLAGNRTNGQPRNCSINVTGADIISEGHNLSDDATCTTFTQSGDKANTPAGVNATLADNGGSTFTHALLTGSAAIDAGKASACPATDQRGFSRQGVCDIGAFEFDGAAPAGGAMRAGPVRRR